MSPPISHSAPRPAPSTHRATEAAPTARATPSAPAATPSPTAARDALHRDSFVADGADRARMAHATGRGGPEQFLGGTMEALRMETRRPDWSNPSETLAHHSQLDAAGATTGDTSRCGATALVGGVILSGPEAPRRLAEARTRVESRLGEVDRGLTARGDREWSRPDTTAFTGMAEAREAHRMLDGLPRDTATWTHSDISRFEEATYRLGRADQALHGERTESGLSGAEMVRMRDTVWGHDWHPTTADGHAVDVVFAGTRSTGGAADLNHFVLGTDDAVPTGTDGGPRRAVVYDPWPQDDGTNFVRGAATPERFLGGLSEGAPVPGRDAPRPGLDLDWWRPLAASPD